MRSAEDIERVLGLAERGLSRGQVAALSGVPLSTVGKWLRNGPPHAWRAGARCRCGHALDHRDRLPEAAYAYLLGLYLGDGHIAPFPRVTCLRIYLDAAYPGIVGECVQAMRLVMPANRVSARHRPTA